MGKISKLFKGELKKIFLGPGIFFMAAFLILALTIAPKLFSPADKTDLSSSISIATTDVKSVYNSYLENKNLCENELSQTISNVTSLINDKSNFKENLTNIFNQMFDLRLLYSSQILTGTQDDLSQTLINFINKTEEFENLYKSYTTNYIIPLILVDDVLDNDIKFEIAQILKILNTTINVSLIEDYIKIDDSLNNYRSMSTLKNLLLNIKDLDYSTVALNDLLTKYSNYNNINQQNINAKIVLNANNATIDEEYNITNKNIEETKDLAYKYLSTLSASNNVIKNQVILEVTKGFSNAEINSYIGFETVNYYKSSELIAKYDYILQNDITDIDLANPFSFNTNSSSKTNTFDYMFFTLEIASVLIIAFTVIIGAGMIAKEYSEGTIKLLAIRPFKRNKIIMSKILATMFLSLILLLTSAIVSFITGSVLYGLSSPTMLIVINSSFAFTLPTAIVMIIYLICLIIKIWIFALLSIAISTLFKSYILSVCISVGIYIVNLILTFVSQGASWLKYNVFANLDLFKFFGGSNIVNYSTNENLTRLFISPVFADTSIWISLLSISILAILLNALLFNVFKHRDIV